jgi:hypothetical protein
MTEKILGSDIEGLGEVRRGMRILRIDGEPTKILSVKKSLVEEEPGETSAEEDDSWVDVKYASLASFLDTHIPKLSTYGDIDKQARVLRNEFDLWMKDPGWKDQPFFLYFEDLMPVAESEFARVREQVLGKGTDDFRERSAAERNRFEKMFEWGHVLAVLETTVEERSATEKVKTEPISISRKS